MNVWNIFCMWATWECVYERERGKAARTTLFLMMYFQVKNISKSSWMWEPFDSALVIPECFLQVSSILYFYYTVVPQHLNFSVLHHFWTNIFEFCFNPWPPAQHASFVLKHTYPWCFRVKQSGKFHKGQFQE